MKNLRQMTAQLQHLVVRLALVAMSILIVSLAPTAALAAPPATVATCEGIKNAYLVLGTQCNKAYNKINHNPLNAAARLTTFRARVSVLQIFQKALLCNGLFGANSSSQQRFQNGETGHLTALTNLHTAMETNNDPNIPPAYGIMDLKLIKINNKMECK